MPTTPPAELSGSTFFLHPILAPGYLEEGEVRKLGPTTDLQKYLAFSQLQEQEVERALDQEPERLRFQSQGHPSSCEALGQLYSCMSLGVCSHIPHLAFIQQTFIYYITVSVCLLMLLCDKSSSLHS